MAFYGSAFLLLALLGALPAAASARLPASAALALSMLLERLLAYWLSHGGAASGWLALQSPWTAWALRTCLRADLLKGGLRAGAVLAALTAVQRSVRFGCLARVP